MTNIAPFPIFSLQHSVFGISSRPPEKPANSFTKICGNPSKTRDRQAPSSLNFFWRPALPVLRSFSGGGSGHAAELSRPWGNTGGASQLRGAPWSAAVSRAAGDRPQRVGSSSRVEYLRRGHSGEAAAAGRRHSRGPGDCAAFTGGNVFKFTFRGRGDRVCGNYHVRSDSLS